MNGDKALNLFRWIALLPASMILMMTASLVVFTANDVFIERYSEVYLFTIGMLGQFAGGYVFVYVGCLIAPSHQKKTAIALIFTLFLFMLSGWINNGAEAGITNLTAVIGGWVAYRTSEFYKSRFN